MIDTKNRMDMCGVVSKEVASIGGRKFVKPVVKLIGWVPEEEAAKIRAEVFGQSDFQRSTITRWRIAGLIRAINIYGCLWLVNEEDVRTMEAPPKGSPLLIGRKSAKRRSS